MDVTRNRYGDYSIASEVVPVDVPVFEEALRSMMAEWTRRMDGVARCVWIELTLPDQCAHIAAVYALGFTLHHAHVQTLQFMRWVVPESPPSSPSDEVVVDDAPRIPDFGTHLVRVEAILFSEDRSRLLLVKERYGRRNSVNQLNWKLPSGNVDHGERIEEALEREVLEELGVRVQYEGIVAFANRSSARRGRNEILVCCVVRLCDDEKGQPTPHRGELIDARWAPVTSVMARWRYPNAMKQFERSALCAALARVRMQSTTGEQSMRIHTLI